MPQRSSLIDSIVESLGFVDEPERRITVVGEGGEEAALSHAELASASLAMSGALGLLGAKAGDFAVLALPASTEYLSLMLGCILRGVVPCTVPAAGKRFKTTTTQVFEVACRLYRPRLLIAPDVVVADLAARLADTSVRVIGLEQICAAAAAGAPPGLCTKSLDDPHHVQLTSGSISRPKAAVLTHRNVHANMRGIVGALGYNAENGDGTVSWLPLHHDMGLITLLCNVHYRGPMVQMQPNSFIRNPLGWLKTIAAVGATTSAVPTFALRYCVRRFKESSMRGVDLARLRSVLIGAERVDDRTLREFAQTFAPFGLHPSALQPCYGMAESTLAITLHDTGGLAPSQRLEHMVPDTVDARALIALGIARPSLPTESHPSETFVSVGRPIPGMAYEIRDAAGHRAAERGTGEIFIRGSSVMQGYLPCGDEAPPETFDDQGWFGTGDVGYSSDGHLFVLGRLKEIIIIRGANYFPHEFEEVVGNHAAACKGACAAIGVPDDNQGTERLVLLVEAHLAHWNRTVQAEMQQLLLRTLGHSAQAIVFVEPGTLPRTTSGKLQRLKARELYMNGAYGAPPADPALPN